MPAGIWLFNASPWRFWIAEFAKEQLLLLGRVWYQHPNGQVPGYEWDFGGVNPPVLASAAWQVYEIDRGQRGIADASFWNACFTSCLLSFTWWVNRKDADGMNVFQGGFLGLDNIGLFDRSQSRAVGWSCRAMRRNELDGQVLSGHAHDRPRIGTTDMAYEDIALKFFEHFLYIANAMVNIAGESISLWDEQDEFFYDVLHFDAQSEAQASEYSNPCPVDGRTDPAVRRGHHRAGDSCERLPEFKRRLLWFLENRPQLAALVSRWHQPGMGERRLLAILRGHRMKRVLHRMLDEAEFLSPHGVRSLSRVYAGHPYSMDIGGELHSVDYEPAESHSGLFGGNSNWRGPVWMPLNYLIIDALHQFHHYYGDDFVVEFPTGTGQLLSLRDIASNLTDRLLKIFVRGADGRRAVFGSRELFQSDPLWRDYVPFHEYFHGDTGMGLGASHQTGWTALIASLIQEQADHRQGAKA